MIPCGRVSSRRPGRVARERAQGLVEFAIIFPIIALILTLIIDGGLLMGRYNNINNAAKEGARLGAVGATQSDIVTRVEQQAHGELDSAATDCGSYNTSATAICVEWIDGPPIDGAPGPGPGKVGSSVRVRAKYHYTPFTPLIRELGGWDVEVCAVQRLEQPVDSPANTSDTTSCQGGSGSGTPTSVPSTDTPVPTSTSVPSTSTPVPPTNTPTPSCPPGYHWDEHAHECKKNHP